MYICCSWICDPNMAYRHLSHNGNSWRWVYKSRLSAWIDYRPPIRGGLIQVLTIAAMMFPCSRFSFEYQGHWKPWAMVSFLEAILVFWIAHPRKRTRGFVPPKKYIPKQLQRFLIQCSLQKAQLYVTKMNLTIYAFKHQTWSAFLGNPNLPISKPPWLNEPESSMAIKPLESESNM